MSPAVEPVRIRPLEDGDEDAVLAAFAAAFPGAPRAREHWRWLYLRNPAGRRAFVAERGGAILAHYAALPARTWIDGRARSFCQVVDSFVVPQARGGLQRPGLLVRTAQAFFDAHGGRERDVVFFGLPVEAALRIGERFLGYETVRTQDRLERAVGPQGAGRPPAEVEELAAFDHQALWLWERCAAGFGASTVRDAEWLAWRYLRAPHRRYTPLGVRDGAGVLRGLAVLARGIAGADEVAALADWLVPPGEQEVGDALLAALEARARADGARSLVALMPLGSPWHLRFQELGFLVRPSAYRMVARSFDRRLDAAWLRAHWWYQPGDTDLV